MRSFGRSSRLGQRGSAAVETALVVTFVLTPLLMFALETFSYRRNISTLSREGYAVAVSLATTPDTPRTDSEIETAFAGIVAAGGAVDVASHCSCTGTLGAGAAGYTLLACTSACPSGEKITWKRVRLSQTYTPMFSTFFVGSGTASAEFLIATEIGAF
jgi:Flp pilus assembly protein TadG